MILKLNSVSNSICFSGRGCIISKKAIRPDPLSSIPIISNNQGAGRSAFYLNGKPTGFLNNATQIDSNVIKKEIREHTTEEIDKFREYISSLHN